MKKDKRNSPPIDNKMYHPGRYKTELCRQFEELGTCEHKEKCLYAHGQAELRQASGRHPKFKTQLCTAFHNEGFCSFGPRCSFIHSKPNVQVLVNEIQSKINFKSSFSAQELDFIKNLVKEHVDPKEHLKALNLLPKQEDSSDYRLPIFINICSNK